MASLLLLDPPTSTDSAHSSAIVAGAPAFLRAQKGAFQLPWPASLILSNESQEKWVSYENILIASLQTGDFTTAKKSLEAITARFGTTNERVIILDGMYREATASDTQQLQAVLKSYDEVLVESPTMFGVAKRRVACLKSIGKTTEAVTALVSLLDASPTDAEAWVELADLYLVQGSIEQAVFALEEVVLIVPNAWNIQAKLGEVLFLQSARAEGGEAVAALNESILRFCRSVELGGEYLRGFYGLKQATAKYLDLVESTASLPRQKAEKLNELATVKLAEIIRKSKTQKDWNGYDRTELDAARALLDQPSAKVAR